MYQDIRNGLVGSVAIRKSRIAASARPRTLPPMLRLLRPQQWVKNAFVLAPLFFTPDALSPATLVRVLAGLICFCLLSSAVYVLNDYMDREADRMHPAKCMRPIAAGLVAPGSALMLLAGLLAAAMAGAFALSFEFAAMAGAYLLINVVYSMGLKNYSIIDVMLITLGFVLRVYAGASLIAVQPSVWIIVCTGLVALFLALAKRRDDVVRSVGDAHRRSLSGYTKPFLDTAVSVVLGALLISYIIYTTDETVMERMGSENLFMTIPLVIIGILRYLQIVLVEERSGAPTAIVLSDRFLIAAMASWAASFVILIHL